MHAEDEPEHARADDHLVEPLFAALGRGERGTAARETRRLGCGGAVLLACLLTLLISA